MTELTLLLQNNKLNWLCSMFCLVANSFVVICLVKIPQHPPFSADSKITSIKEEYALGTHLCFSSPEPKAHR